MKKSLLGLVFILLAAYVLLQDILFLPDFGMSLWTLMFILGFGFYAIQNFLRRNYVSAYVCAVIAFIILEKHYDFLNVSTGTMILAAILAGLGVGMIFNPKGTFLSFKGKIIDGDYAGSSEYNTVFANTTRYINDDNLLDIRGDVVFSGTSIYFTNAVILGDKATYSGDAVFSNVKLYVPKSWNVVFTGDRVLSNIKNYSSGQPTDKTLVVTGDFIFSQVEVIYI